MSRLSFSGHESFVCKTLWLKKGYDYVLADKKFGDPSAVTALGVGKNMVHSISHWMRAFGLLKDDVLTEEANYLFEKDPYLERAGSLWLLHYWLITKGKERASIYNLVFNEYLPEVPEFEKKHLLRFLNAKLAKEGLSASETTLDKDIQVFLKMYLQPDSQRDIEEAYSSILIDLGLLQTYSKPDPTTGHKEDWYKVRQAERINLPDEVFLYAILRWKELRNQEGILSIRAMLLDEAYSPAKLFVMTENAFFKRLEALTAKRADVFLTENAGIQTLQVHSLTAQSILDSYYEY